MPVATLSHWRPGIRQSPSLKGLDAASRGNVAAARVIAHTGHNAAVFYRNGRDPKVRCAFLGGPY